MARRTMYMNNASGWTAPLLLQVQIVFSTQSYSRRLLSRAGRPASQPDFLAFDLALPSSAMLESETHHHHRLPSVGLRLLLLLPFCSRRFAAVVAHHPSEGNT